MCFDTVLAPDILLLKRFVFDVCRSERFAMRRTQDPDWTPKGDGVFTSDEFDSEDDVVLSKEPTHPQVTPQNAAAREVGPHKSSGRN